MNNVILTIYYTNSIDPQRNCYKLSNNFGLISTLYNSVIKNNMNLVIFYDSLNDKFIKKYSNSNVSFVNFTYYIDKYKYDMTSMNDIRFLIYRDYLIENPIYNKVLITDLFDEEFYANIFDEILLDNHIYANYDRERTYEHYFLTEKIFKTYKYNKFENFKKNKIIQASMFSGYNNIIVEFLNYVKNEFDNEIINKNYNNNYIVLNYVFYQYFSDRIIFAHKGLSFKTTCAKEKIYGTWKKKLLV